MLLPSRHPTPGQLPPCCSQPQALLIRSSLQRRQLGTATEPPAAQRAPNPSCPAASGAQAQAARCQQRPAPAPACAPRAGVPTRRGQGASVCREPPGPCSLHPRHLWCSLGCGGASRPPSHNAPCQPQPLSPSPGGVAHRAGTVWPDGVAGRPRSVVTLTGAAGACGGRRGLVWMPSLQMIHGAAAWKPRPPWPPPSSSPCWNYGCPGTGSPWPQLPNPQHLPHRGEPVPCAPGTPGTPSTPIHLRPGGAPACTRQPGSGARCAPTPSPRPGAASAPAPEPSGARPSPPPHGRGAVLAQQGGLCPSVHPSSTAW